MVSNSSNGLAEGEAHQGSDPGTFGKLGVRERDLETPPHANIVRRKMGFQVVNGPNGIPIGEVACPVPATTPLGMATRGWVPTAPVAEGMGRGEGMPSFGLLLVDMVLDVRPA